MIGMIVWIPAEQRKLGVTERPGHAYVVPLCTDSPRPPDAGVDAAAQDPVGGGETASIGDQTGGAAGGLSLAGFAGKEGPSDGGDHRFAAGRLAVEWTRAALEARGCRNPGSGICPGR